MATNSINKNITPEQHSRVGLVLKIAAAVVGCIILAGSGVFAFNVIANKSVAEETATAVLRQAVSLDTVISNTVTVTSKLGFGVTFNKSVLDIDAKVITGATTADVYTQEDAYKTNSYAIMNLTVKKGVTNASGVGLSFPPALAILTNANRDFFANQRAKMAGNPTDEQIVISHYAPKPAAGSVSKLISQAPEKIGDITYQKLTYQLVNENYPSNAETQIQYVTVQNGRPFALVVEYFAGTQQGDLAPLLDAIAAVQYAPPASDAKYLTMLDDTTSFPASQRSYGLAQFASQTETLNTPDDLSSEGDIKLVAKNQIAVVRVGTINCYDLTLVLPTGAPALQAPDACAAGTGSGSIISSDGHVATNGHVVQLIPAQALSLYIQLSLNEGNLTPLKQYMAYLSATKVVTPQEAAAIEKALPLGDKNAFRAFAASLSKVPAAHIKSNKLTRSYVIQLSNDPIKIAFNGTHIDFKSPKTVVDATYVDANYDPAADPQSATAATSDVAIVKITDGKKFPSVALGNADDLKKNDDLTVIGFPGFVDGGLQTKQSHTVPTATQGDVRQMAKPGRYRLIETSVPLAEGNSGGPAFDSQGKQIGLATYVIQSAKDPDLGITKLGKYSYMRDVADLKALASKNKVTPSSSSVSDDWQAGIDAFYGGDYQKALTHFKNTSSAYTENYLVTDLTAKAQTAADEALRKLAVPAAIVLAATIAMIVLVVLIVRHHRHKPVMPQPLYPAA